MKAFDVMTKEVYYVTPDQNIARVKNLFLKHGISTVLVLEEDRPAGLVGEPELAEAFYQARRPVDEIPVKKVMNEDVLTVGPQDPPEGVAGKLLEKNTKAAIVFSDEVLGIITKTDLLNYFIQLYPGKARIKDLMDEDLLTVKPFHSLFHAVREMEEKGVNRVIVLDQGRVRGILSMKDVALISDKRRPSKLIFDRPDKEGQRREVQMLPFTVQDTMKSPVQTINPHADATSAAKLMLEKNIGSLVVTQDHDLKGIITKTDITRFLSQTK